MKISHESPICMLESARDYNDYDYALVHLFEKYPKYKKFFELNLKCGRIVYLDNSLFELGVMFDHKKFAEEAEYFSKINSENFYYVIPDSLEDFEATINSFEEFTKNYKIKGNKIGVVQGKNFEELLECFKFMKTYADVVAISFDYSYYEKMSNYGDNIFQKYMEGRQLFIKYLKDHNFLEDTKVHLLGCSLPQEFIAYRGIKEIISCDTSNPIVHGILNIKYKDYGLDNKEEIKLVDFIDIPELKINWKCVMHNIAKFRKFVNGI